ncbi:MAG: hypothetical protein JSS89_02280 [Bacteroidetes bacterium]|nr:hypothetical protein [Bacteroidota bacterium]
MRTTSTILLLGFIMLAGIADAQATDLRGRINQYAAVSSFDTCRNTVRITPVAWLKKGDRIMLLQMKGVHVDTSRTDRTGAINDVANAGLWELCTVDTVMGGTVRLTHRPIHRYSTTDGVQLIKVARSTSADVTGLVTAQAWNGTSGGVIAIECTDTLRLHASLDAGGMGYRGGAVSLNTLDTAETSWATRDDAGLGGRKGEGSAAAVRALGAGRSPWSSGGGGGNARNGGGGGGGNGGEGGMGGTQPSTLFPTDVRGRGGYALATNDPHRLFLGGGGGGGHQNDFKGSAGAAGGGIIVVIASVVIVDSGVVLDARGATARNALEDGAGGGGAGGSIAFFASTIVGTAQCVVDGGDGGENNGTNGCYAPGGGGGGGRVITSIPVAASVLGGSAGMARDVTCSSDVRHGASSGTDGVRLQMSDLPMSTSTFVVPRIVTPDTTVCGRSKALVRAMGGAQYDWWVNDALQPLNAPEIEVTPTKKRNQVICAIMTNDGCVFRDTMRVDTTSCAEPTSDVGFRIDDVRGRPGDSVDVVIHVSTRDSIRYPATIRFRLMTRASVLVPQRDASTGSQLSRAWRWMWMQMPTYAGLTDTVLRIPMMVTLGDDERSMITIDSFTVDDARVIPRLGRFGICSLDVCMEAGPRLFDPSAGTLMQRRGRSLVLDGTSSRQVTVRAFDVGGRQYPQCIMTNTPCELHISDLFCDASTFYGWVVLTIDDHDMVVPWFNLP